MDLTMVIMELLIVILLVVEVYFTVRNEYTKYRQRRFKCELCGSICRSRKGRDGQRLCMKCRKTVNKEVSL